MLEARKDACGFIRDVACESTSCTRFRRGLVERTSAPIGGLSLRSRRGARTLQQRGTETSACARSDTLPIGHVSALWFVMWFVMWFATSFTGSCAPTAFQRAFERLGVRVGSSCFDLIRAHDLVRSPLIISSPERVTSISNHTGDEASTTRPPRHHTLPALCRGRSVFRRVVYLLCHVIGRHGDHDSFGPSRLSAHSREACARHTLQTQYADVHGATCRWRRVKLA